MKNDWSVEGPLGAGPDRHALDDQDPARDQGHHRNEPRAHRQRHRGGQGARSAAPAIRPIAALKAAFDAHKADLGFGLLLEEIRQQRSMQVTPRSDRQGGGGHDSRGRADVLGFRFMVGLGFLFLALFALALWYSIRKRVSRTSAGCCAGRCGSCRRRGSPANSAGSSPNTAASPGPSTACCRPICRVSTLSVGEPLRLAGWLSRLLHRAARRSNSI